MIPLARQEVITLDIPLVREVRSQETEVSGPPPLPERGDNENKIFGGAG
jgi:hypothetical protein